MTESPRAFRERNPYTPPPPEYKHPSMLVQHWRLATLFALVCIAFAVYCFKAPRAPSTASDSNPMQPVSGQPTHPMPAPATPSSQPAEPVYVDQVPDKDHR